MAPFTEVGLRDHHGPVVPGRIAGRQPRGGEPARTRPGGQGAGSGRPRAHWRAISSRAYPWHPRRLLAASGASPRARGASTPACLRLGQKAFAIPWRELWMFEYVSFWNLTGEAVHAQTDRVGSWEVSCLAAAVVWRVQSTTVRIGEARSRSR